MHSTEPIGIAVVGLGFMGRTHLRAYRAAAEAGWPCRLVAVCDGDRERLDGRDVAAGTFEHEAASELLFDPSAVQTTTEFEALLDNPEVQALSLCTPTDSHVELAVRALEAGRHVLIEKPVAVESAGVERVLAAQRASGGVCMPAFCIRFWPGWDWLRETIRAGTHGAVRTAAFHRLANPPAWSSGFYTDPLRSGGALVDLHIHDADFVRWCFGEPEAVASTGTLDHLTTLYRFPGGPPHVVAEGGWDHHPGFGFRMRYLVNFEGATADYDLGRPEVLLLHREGESTAVELPPGEGYDGEVRHFVDLVAGRVDEPLASLEEALGVARLLEREREALGSPGWVTL